jgi:hypothetical protein
VLLTRPHKVLLTHPRVSLLFDRAGIPGNLLTENGCGKAGSRSNPLAPFLSQVRGAKDRKFCRSNAGESEGGSCIVVPNCEQVWSRQLHDGYAVVFMNYSASVVPHTAATTTAASGPSTAGKSALTTSTEGGGESDDEGEGDGAGAGDGSSPKLVLAECDSTDLTQQWNITTKGGGGGDPAMSVVKSKAGNKASPPPPLSSSSPSSCPPF